MNVASEAEGRLHLGLPSAALRPALPRVFAAFVAMALAACTLAEALRTEPGVDTAAVRPGATREHHNTIECRRLFSMASRKGLPGPSRCCWPTNSSRFCGVNVSRGLPCPITLEPDHNAVLAAWDSGFLQIHCAGCQEVLDSVLLAYRLAEDKRVRLPVIVNLDGFYLSFTRESVEVHRRPGGAALYRII